MCMRACTLHSGKNAAAWLLPGGSWSDTLMTMYHVELEDFLEKSEFTIEEKEDLHQVSFRSYTTVTVTFSSMGSDYILFCS